MIISTTLAEELGLSDRKDVAMELEVLGSIYDRITPWYTPESDTQRYRTDGYVRYQIEISLPPPHSEASIKILVSLPPNYPESAPPQLQLISRYIGPFGVDSILFGSILKTYISEHGVTWTNLGNVCIFDGLENVTEHCVRWYDDHVKQASIDSARRETEKHSTRTLLDTVTTFGEVNHANVPRPLLPLGVKIFEAEPLIDRKSSFVGRACAITDPSQVPVILAYLTSDRKISRAAHPIIHAWRVTVGGIRYQDNDDDGESAAGGRLAHLLQIMDIDNVLVIVSRYFGGIHLGPDRFKHINHAARNAIDLAGFLDADDKEARAARRTR